MKRTGKAQKDSGAETVKPRLRLLPTLLTPLASGYKSKKNFTALTTVPEPSEIDFIRL